MSKSNNTGGGIGLSGLVFIVFLFLKLAGMGRVATWSWWWVTSPLWIPFGIILAILAVAGIIGVVGVANRLIRRGE